MKVEVKENDKVKGREFPKLMVYENVLVLMISEGNGVRLDKHIQYNDHWTMSKFSDFEGSIILSND